MTEPETDPTREAARESLEHLQAAARELINAARAALDAAERFIDDPEMISSVVGVAGRVGDVLRQVSGDRIRRSAWDDGPDDDGGDRPEPGDSGIQRIILE